jgi:hypothetical protein
MHGEPDMSRRATRSGIVAMDKAFGANLTRLVEYRARQAEAQTAQAQKAETSAAGQTAASAQGRPADAPARGQKAEPRAETEIADRMLRHQTRSTPTRADPATAPDGEMVPIPTRGPDVQTPPASAAAPGGPHETSTAVPGQTLAASRTPGEHRAASAGAPGQSGSSRPQPVDQPDALRAFPEADKAPARRQASP